MNMAMRTVMMVAFDEGDESDQYDGRDTGDGQLPIMVNMMVKMMAMLVVIIIFVAVAIRMMMYLVKCWS